MINNGFRLRRKCIEHGVPTITSLDTLVAVIDCLQNQTQPKDIKPYELGSFADIVRSTRNEIVPMNEAPPENKMLKK